MDIQFEVQKIHSQFGTTEMANYQIQMLFETLIMEDRNEQLLKHDAVKQNEQLKALEFLKQKGITGQQAKTIAEWMIEFKSKQPPILKRCGCEEPNEEPIKICMSCDGYLE